MAKLSAAEGLICLYSFVLGGLRFSIISFSFYFCTSTLRISPSNTILFCHTFMASMYLSETLTGTVSKTRLGVQRTAVVLSSILVFIFVFPLFWGEYLWIFYYIAVSLLMLVCAILGGLIHCLKHIFINEYNLPQEHNRYMHMKFLVVELEYIGKTLGGFLAMGTVMEEPSTFFTGACWMSFSISQLFITLAGLRIFREQKDNRNIIKEFIKHTFFAMRSQLRNRRDESEKFSADDEERIKMVHSVLPLYVPVIILIGLKDLKYSRYTWQTTQLSLDTFDGSYNPQKILIFYPLTVSVFLPVYHYGLNPLLKKLMTLRMRTTTRAIVSFYFMALSLSFATILECRIELDHKSVRLNRTMSIVEMYNFLPCTAVLSLNCQGHVRYEVPPLDLVTLRCPLIFDYNAMLIQGICDIDGVTRYYSMTAVLSRQQEVRVAFGYDLRRASKIVDRKMLPIFFQHLHQTNVEIPHLPRLTIIYNVAQDHELRIVPASHTIEGWVPSGPDVFEKSLKYQLQSRITQVEIVKDGWYAILINDMMMGKVNYKSTIKTYTVMISQDNPKNETVVKVILVRQIPSRHVLHQLPQVIMSAFAEMMIEAPGFVYGRKKVPLQWNDFVSVVWTFCSFLGNLIIIIGGFVSHVERNLSAFLIGSACSIVAIALISVFLLDYYKADYVEG